jgi:glycosyltransferase involved in cell wall biosynthesis
MRIGHYAPEIKAKGGIAAYIRRTGRAQSKRGHDVVYFGRAESSGQTTASSETGSKALHPVVDDAALFDAANDLSLDLLHLHKSVRALPSDRVPTVRTMHGHQGGCPSGTRYLARTGAPCNRTYSVPGCLWGHVVDRCGSVRPHKLKRDFTRIRREHNQAQKIPTYTVSDFVRRQMVRAGCDGSQLQTIRSPTPTVANTFTPVPERDPPHFLFAGRLVPEKGLGWALRALANTEMHVHLDVAGRGRKRDALETQAEELSVRDCVTFHGWVDPDQIPNLMRDARAVLFPSVWHEPAGLITLEAAAQGRALIASRVGGIPEYAQEDHAVLVDAHDVEGLARAMDCLAKDSTKANQMGRSGHQHAQSTYSMSRFLDQLDAFYASAQPACA